MAKHLKFYEDVAKMRDLQKQYFSTRSQEVLAKSKKAEREVDLQIKNFFNPPLF